MPNIDTRRQHLEIVAYDPAWPRLYERERAEIIEIAGDIIAALEHIGSTAMPGLAAKPVIDMMAAVRDLEAGPQLIRKLEARDYQLIETGMRNRLLLCRPAEADSCAFHLHVVARSTFDTRKERLMRDYLVAHQDTAAAYGALKAELAQRYGNDSLADARAKTDFIQGLIDRAHGERRLPPIDVWNDD